ncbi:MAG: hypothetical protein L6R38_001960 [Xanthoria sp. 2 TBL-2021]|nr:MAG: hypothetical protein L6R38_001960 [Xanthoria sp. 2 TBL-2021]
MDDASEDGSETSERTVLSESGDETNDKVTHHGSLSSGPKKHPVDSVSNTTSLANIWQFLLSRPASEFTRFYTYNFLPADTVTNIAEGTSYRVSKSKLLVGSQQVVAIKHVIPQQSGPLAESAGSSQNTLDTVLRELRVLAHKPVVKNVNVAQLVGYGAEELQGRFAIYLVADFASGGTLKDYLSEHGDASMLERANYCYDISSGLAGLHACDIVQGDLKLANVLVFADEEGFVAKLSDFGCSIFEGPSVYTGSKTYNAPEIRRGRSNGVGSKVDFYASDIFSLGLVIWETLQGGRMFIDPALQENHLTWLNGLPKDDLLLQALQTFEVLPIQGTFPKRVLRSVLEGCLRDEPEQRLTCKAIVEIFRSDRNFSNSKRNTSSYISPSKIPPLRKWSFTRTDNLARAVPVALQTELFTQLKWDVDCAAEATIEFAYFHLAICHLTGFGTPISQDKFLEALQRGAACGERVPNEIYYSHRIREHEKVLQRSLLDTPFDLCSGNEVLKKGASFKERGTLDAIAMFSLNSSNDKLPLLAVSDAFDSEDFHHVFHLAARLGLNEIINVLLDAGMDVNTRDEKRATPLIAACRGGHADIVHLLMDHGADSWNRQRGDLSPFHWLMMFEDDEIPSVLEKMRSTHNSMVMDAVVLEPLDLLEHGLRLRWSPVHFAVEVRNIAVTKALLDAGASITAGDTTPLNIAVANHCPEMTELLLAHGMPSWQRTPFLHIGEVSTFKLLLLHGDKRRQNLHETAQRVLESVYGDINQKNRDGYTSLAEAIKVIPCDFDLAVLECLLDCGARMDVDEHKIVYCLNAREDGRVGPILDVLIQREAINISIELLMRAVLHGNREILDSILATGIDVNARTDENISPLMSAVLFANNAYAVKALINRGADANAIFEIESDRKSVLEICLALPEGDGQMLDALISGGASVVMEDGSNIVYHACTVPARVNGAHVLRHLLEKHPHLQALVNLEHENYTPIHMASFCGNLEAVSILLEYGAAVDTSTAFNPVATTAHLAMNPEERFVPFERGGFKLERWKLTAEAVLIKLLDKSDPGHGRNLLHIATSICNYDRVVELVERGIQPWRGDSKRITPIGLLPKEVLEYEDCNDSIPPKDLVVQGLKIKKYLEHHMIVRTSQVKSLELIDDTPAPMPPEQDSPFQLETNFKELVDKRRTDLGEDHTETLAAMAKLAEVYMMQERWFEAEELLSMVIQNRQAPEHDKQNDYDEGCSSLIATLIAVNKLEEAESLVNTSLAEATSKALRFCNPPETPSHETVGTFPEIRNAASIIDKIGAVSSSPIALFKLGDTAALDSFIEVSCRTKDPGLAIALFDLSLVMTKWDETSKAMKLKIHAIETIRSEEKRSQPLVIRLVGELICNYCALEKWQEAEQELQSCLSQLNTIAAENFPLTYSILLQVANIFRTYSKWTQAEEIYQRVYGHTVQFRSRESYYSTNTLRLLVNCFEAQLNYTEAGKFQSQLLDTYKRAYGPRSTETQWQKLELARIYQKEDRLVECVILQRQALLVFESFGHDHRSNTLEAKRLLCKALTKQQILDEAEILARENLADFRALHGDGGSATLAAMNDLALVLNNQDRCEEAIMCYQEVLQKQEEIYGEMHEATRSAMTELLPTYIRANIFEEAESLGKRLVRVSETLYGSEGIVTLHVLFYLSGVYEKWGQFEKSRDMKLQVLELERKLHPVGHKETLYTMTELAQTYYSLGEIDEAIALQLEALDGYRQLDGDNAMKIMDTIFALACSYHEAGRLEDARLKYEEAINISRSLLGDQDEKTIAKLAPLMALYTELDEYELAKSLAYETLWFMEEAHGDDHSATQGARQNVIIVMTSLEKWRDAERQAEKLVASLERTHGMDHSDTINAANRLADCLKEQRKYAAAEPLYERVLKYNRQNLAPEDDVTIEVMTSLVSTRRKMDKFLEAAELNQELLNIHTNTLGPDHDTTLETAAIKANILYSREKYQEAATLELQILSTRISSLGPSDPKTLEATENLSKPYLEQGKYEDAAKLAEGVLRIREEANLEDTDEDMLMTIENLKDIYLAAKRWEDARRMVDRELIARQMNAKTKGDNGVIAALESLKLVAEGEGDAQEVAEVVEMANVNGVVDRKGRSGQGREEEELVEASAQMKQGKKVAPIPRTDT